MDTKVTLDASYGIQASSKIDLAIPALIPETIANGNVIRAVVLISNYLLSTGFRIYQLVVKLDRETKIRIAYYDEFSHEMIEVVIPLVAKADAIQYGIDYVTQRGYDPRVAMVVLDRLIGALEN
jgi:hypothetical protein